MDEDSPVVSDEVIRESKHQEVSLTRESANGGIIWEEYYMESETGVISTRIARSSFESERKLQNPCRTFKSSQNGLEEWEIIKHKRKRTFSNESHFTDHRRTACRRTSENSRKIHRKVHSFVGRPNRLQNHQSHSFIQREAWTWSKEKEAILSNLSQTRQSAKRPLKTGSRNLKTG